jgi:hypothetical protein
VPTSRPPVLGAHAIVGQLAAPERLRAVAAIALGAMTPAQIMAASGLSENQVTGALTRLLRSGLVLARDGRLQLDTAAFAKAARAEAPRRAVPDFGDVDAATSKVLRAFIVDGRLRAIPAPGRKRRIVLEYVAAAFEPGIRYPERQVDATLRAWHEDHAALRRYLVEENLLTRNAGLYWRTGGWVDV